jgi:hypothetical protein
MLVIIIIRSMTQRHAKMPISFSHAFDPAWFRHALNLSQKEVLHLNLALYGHQSWHYISNWQRHYERERERCSSHIRCLKNWCLIKFPLQCRWIFEQRLTEILFNQIKFQVTRSQLELCHKTGRKRGSLRSLRVSLPMLPPIGGA